MGWDRQMSHGQPWESGSATLQAGALDLASSKGSDKPVV